MSIQNPWELPINQLSMSNYGGFNVGQTFESPQQKMLRRANAVRGQTNIGGGELIVPDDFGAPREKRQAPITGGDQLAILKARRQSAPGLSQIMGAKTPSRGGALAKALAAGATAYMGRRTNEKDAQVLKTSIQAERGREEEMRQVEAARAEMNDASKRSLQAKQGDYYDSKGNSPGGGSAKIALLDRIQSMPTGTPEEKAYKKLAIEMAVTGKFKDIGGGIKLLNDYGILLRGDTQPPASPEDVLSTAEVVTEAPVGGEIALVEEPAQSGEVRPGEAAFIDQSYWPKDLPPEKELDYVTKVEMAKEKASQWGKTEEGKRQKVEDKPKFVKGLRDGTDQFHTILNNAKKAKELADGWTTGFMGNLGELPVGSPAYQLAQHLKVVKANIMFTTLKGLRDSSTSGSSGLGQLNVKEAEALENSWAGLAQAQSPKEFRSAMDDVTRRAESLMATTSWMYETIYEEPFAYESPLKAPEVSEAAHKRWVRGSNGSLVLEE